MMMPVRRRVALAAVAGACFVLGFLGVLCDPPPAVTAIVPAPRGMASARLLVLANETGSYTNVYLAFGSDSVVLPSSFAVCAEDSGLTCSFPIAPRASETLSFSAYLNATISFAAPVACGVTKAELNLSNPSWYDTVDVSLVDGFSNEVRIDIDHVTIGPPLGPNGNEFLFGVFPLGCDVCVKRDAPPCGQTPGTRNGCKLGTQYNPEVPCQYQGARFGGGGGSVKVALVDVSPAVRSEK